MKLLYIMDPLCGWCYGNSANMIRLEKEFDWKLEIEVLPWGMWVGERARYQSPELAGYIRPADARLRAITWVEMSEAYDRLLDDTSIFLDSEPGSRAINTVKKMNPSLTLTFASILARSRYVDGLDNTILPTFLSVAKTLNIDTKVFQEMHESELLKKYTIETFIRAGEYAHSYPSIFLERGDSMVVPIALSNYHYESIRNEIAENIFDK